MSVKKEDLISFLNEIFSDFSDCEDNCKNGLQVDGKEEIKTIAFSVSATKAAVESAQKAKADALICHHGLFWNFNPLMAITGAHYARIAPLIKNDINLFGYHLPLDGHLEIGNAKAIASMISLQKIESFGSHKKTPIGAMGQLPKALSGRELKELLYTNLKREVFYSPANNKKIKTVGIITGGASRRWYEAESLGLDAYITGEMSEHDYHNAAEAGIHFFACGHHATERGGILNLKKEIEKQFKKNGIKTIFFDSDNPA